MREKEGDAREKEGDEASREVLIPRLRARCCVIASLLTLERWGPP